MIAVESAEIPDQVIELLIRFLQQDEHPLQDICPNQHGRTGFAFSFLHAVAKRRPLLTLANKRFGNGFSDMDVHCCAPRIHAQPGSQAELSAHAVQCPMLRLA